MKRSSCLSALLVGLSLTTATAALAAPAPEGEAKPAKKVAQAQDPSSSGTSNPTAAPSDQGSTTQPAVSVGTSSNAPATDTPQAAAPAPATKPAPRPFAGSTLIIQNSMTTGTVFKGQTQDWNPTAEGVLWFLPRYAINDAFQLRGRLLVNYEYTNSDTTTYKHEPTLSDTTLSLFYRKLPKLPGGIMPNLAINAGLPTSKLSQARTMVVTPGATLQLAKPIEHVLGGEALIIASAIYSHPFYTSRNAEVVDPRPPGAFSCVGGNGCSDLLSGVMNPSDTLAYWALLEMEWGHWSPALYYLGATQWAYSPTQVRNPVTGANDVGRPAGFEPTGVRQTHYFSAWLDYNINSWLTAEVGYFNSTSALNGSGQHSLSNVFFNPYGDTRVYLSAAIQLDNLVKAIQGGGGGEAGVVRAKNTKTPLWTF